MDFEATKKIAFCWCCPVGVGSGELFGLCGLSFGRKWLWDGLLVCLASCTKLLLRRYFGISIPGSQNDLRSQKVPVFV